MDNLPTFRQLCAGHVADGELVCKTQRDQLVAAGYATRDAGFNFLTPTGVNVGFLLGLLTSRPPARVGVEIDFEMREDTGIRMELDLRGGGVPIQRRPPLALASFTVEHPDRWPQFDAARINGLWYEPARDRASRQREWTRLRRG